MKNILLLFIIGTIWSCSKQEYDNTDLNNSEFQPYLDTFLEEARIRGYDYTSNNINFYLADIEDEEIRGLCNQRRERIIIDRDKWENSTDIIKERLIFHELGHCILGRGHRNDKSLSGECLSLMDGVENDFRCSDNSDSALWREYYLDELFDRNTVLPKWYTDNQKYVSTYTNQSVIVSIVDLNTDFYSIPFDFSNKDKFVIEFTFKDWNAVSNNLNLAVPKVVVGGVITRIDPFSEVTEISFYREPWGLFFDNRDYKFQKDMKLTIIKNNDLLQFFFDEQLMHITENIPFNKNVIEASFDYPINMDIEIFEFE